MLEESRIQATSLSPSPLNFINRYKERGWINVGNTRMVFFDVKQGFYQIRRVIEREVGENSNFVVFQAGIRGGYSFLIPMIRRGDLQPDFTGFLKGINIYSEAGFGDFKIIDLKWDKGWVVIQCKNAIEGWAYVENHQISEKPICDYTRGIFLSFMKGTHRFANTGLFDQLDCIETLCIGKGDEICEYIIGKKETLKKQGYELSTPRISLQNQLKDIVRRKTKEIKKASHFYENIINNAPVAIFTLDSNGNLITTNPIHLKLFKLPKKRLRGMNFLKFPVVSSSGLSQYLRSGLNGKAFELTNFPISYGPHGEPLYLSVKGIPFKDEGADRLLCIIEDTTEKTKNSKHLEQLKELNENIIQSITDGILVLDKDFNIMTWNRTMERLLGIRQEDVLGKNLIEIGGENIWEDFFEKLHQVMNTGLAIEEKGFKVKTFKKGVVTVNLKILPLFDEKRNVNGIIVLHDDISEKEKMELQYKNLFDKARDGILVTDLEGNFVSLNDAAQKIFGPRKYLKKEKIYRFVVPSNKKLLKEILQEVVGGREKEPFELTVINLEGIKIPVEISLTAIQEEQKTAAIQFIMRDISERKKMEQKLIQASKMSAVGELASGVAHEINNPLASIAGYAEELLDRLDRSKDLRMEDRAEFSEYLSTIIEQVYRCKEITKNLLNFARNDPLRPVRTNLLEVINKAIALVEFEAKGRNIRFIKMVGKEDVKVFTDPCQLQQVLLNLLKNAVEAVGSYGLIKIATHTNNGNIEVRISDNGKGIPLRDLKKIFDPFFTTKPPSKGTGLGLPISYMIMQRLNGRIEVQSQEGKGSTFTIILPQKEKI